MADKELDKMKLATMLNSTPSSGGLNATNTRTPSFVDPSSRLSLALDEWRRGNAPAAYLLRGDPQGLINELTTPKPVPTTEQSLQDMYNFAVGSIAPIEGGAESSFSSNLNLKPRISADKLKGPDLQPAQNFMQQVKSLPGVTKEGLKNGAKGIDVTNDVMSKQDFANQFKAPEYKKVDLKTLSSDINEHYRDIVEDNLDDYDVFRSMGLPNELHDHAANIMYGGGELEDLPKNIQKQFKDHGYHDVSSLEDAFMMEKENSIANGIEYLLDTDGHDAAAVLNGQPSYKYIGHQRILDQFTPIDHKYFEIGVTHPAQEGIPYRHYNDADAPKGLIGHVRGSFLNEDANNIVEGTTFPKNSMLIEEIQSDAQQKAAQTGPLHQVHGTLFKAAVQHALENGADTVYLPTANTIKEIRRYEPTEAPHLNIYDTDIIKEGLNPTLQIPGVKHSLVTSDAPRKVISHTTEAQRDAMANRHAINQTGLNSNYGIGADLHNTLMQGQTSENGIADFILKNAKPEEYSMLKDKYGERKYGEIINKPFTSINANSMINDIIAAAQQYTKDNPLITSAQDTSAPLYHKIEFSPEAKDTILNGSGQTAPGYKKGGSVKMAGGGSPSDTVEVGTPMAKAMGTYPFQQSEAPLEAPMFSPDDLIGTGIPTAASKAILALGLKDAAKEALMSSGSFFKNMFTKPEDIAAYKNEFTHGFYHGTPNPKNILAEGGFDDRIAFVTPNPKFANRFAGSEVGGVNRAGEPTAPTVLPLSVRLGKVFEPKTPDAKQLLNEYAEFVKNDLPLSKKSQNAMYNGKWEHIEEDRDFLDFLKDKGYDSFGVYENGQKNYGIFDPSRIRSAFAKFDPSDAKSADLLKAEGGSVKKIDTKSKNSDIMHQSLAQMRAEILRRNYGN